MLVEWVAMGEVSTALLAPGACEVKAEGAKPIGAHRAMVPLALLTSYESAGARSMVIEAFEAPAARK